MNKSASGLDWRPTLRALPCMVMASIPLLGFLLPTQAWAQQSASGVKELARWPHGGGTQSAAWGPSGRQIAYSARLNGRQALMRYNLRTKKATRLAWTESCFLPSFGPTGTLFAGAIPTKTTAKKARPSKKTKTSPSKSTKAPSKPPKKTKKPPKEKSKAAKKSANKPKERPKVTVSKRAPLTKKRRAKKVASLLQEARRTKAGITLWGYNSKSMLFPGCRPRYSQAARRLLFSHEGLLYLWNPMKTRRGGLMLLTRGEDPVWSPDGRAIVFLRQPFVVTKGRASGGGISVVDMLFRAARVTQSGGEVTWSSDGRTLAFIDALPQAQQGLPKGTPALYILPLKGKPKPTLLVPHARAPHLPPNAQMPNKPLLAYHDKQGVWLIQTKTKKRRLIAKHASNPRWSSQGRLLVQTPTHFVILQLTSLQHW